MGNEFVPFLDSVRLFLHVIGVAIWAGDKLILAAPVTFLKSHDPELPKLVARKFNRIAWFAYALLIISGVCPHSINLLPVITRGFY